jgi:hypothetical protein
MPSTTFRMSRIDRPTPFHLGNNGANTNHTSSEISCLIVMPASLTHNKINAV